MARPQLAGDSYNALARLWQPVLQWYDASPCPVDSRGATCSLVAPLVASWRDFSAAWQRGERPAGLADQWDGLKAAGYLRGRGADQLTHRAEVELARVRAEPLEVRPFEALQQAWAPILAWYDTAAPLCPCRTHVAKFVSSWRYFEPAWLAGEQNPNALAEQWVGYLTARALWKQLVPDADELEDAGGDLGAAPGVDCSTKAKADAECSTWDIVKAQAGKVTLGDLKPKASDLFPVIAHATGEHPTPEAEASYRALRARWAALITWGVGAKAPEDQGLLASWAQFSDDWESFAGKADAEGLRGQAESLLTAESHAADHGYVPPSGAYTPPPGQGSIAGAGAPVHTPDPDRATEGDLAAHWLAEHVPGAGPEACTVGLFGLRIGCDTAAIGGVALVAAVLMAGAAVFAGLEAGTARRIGGR
jgi:hypothetical protein